MAAHRQNRPWTGRPSARAAPRPFPPYVRGLLPVPGQRARRRRAQRRATTRTFVFDNDHPCVGPDAPAGRRPAAALPEPPRPRHRARRLLQPAPRPDARRAAAAARSPTWSSVWQQQYRDLGGARGDRPRADFENKGEVVGRLEPAPALPDLRDQLRLQDHRDRGPRRRARHLRRHRPRAVPGHPRAPSAADGRRILFENDTAIAFVPYFARYAYEVYVAPKATRAERGGPRRRRGAPTSPSALRHVTVQFDNLWRMPFPYVHGAAPGAHRRRRPSRLPLPHRVPSPAAQARPAEVPGGSRDRRRQLPLGHRRPRTKAAELRALPDVHYAAGA